MNEHQLIFAILQAIIAWEDGEGYGVRRVSLNIAAASSLLREMMETSMHACTIGLARSALSLDIHVCKK